MVITKSEDGGDVAVFIAFEVHGDKSPVCLAQPADGPVEGLSVGGISVRGVWDQLFAGKDGGAWSLITLVGKDGIERDAVKPGAELRFASISGPGFPGLQENILGQVFAPGAVIRVKRDQLNEQEAAGVDLGQEFVLGGCHSKQVITISLGSGLLMTSGQKFLFDY